MLPSTDASAAPSSCRRRGQRRLAARRQLDRRALLDAEHPRLVRVRAVEARDLDVHGAVRVLGDDERHLFVGEAAVVGDAEHAQALRRRHRNVAEHLGDDRLACAAAGLARRLPPGATDVEGFGSRSGGGTGPNTTRSSSTPEVAETHGHLRAGSVLRDGRAGRSRGRRRSRCSRGTACPCSTCRRAVALDGRSRTVWRILVLAGVGLA